MDLVSCCKKKLGYFRVKELKDILTKLGLSKQGKKQDLVDRISAILSDARVLGILAKKKTAGKDEVAKLVDDTYRKMQGSGAADLASRGVSDSANIKHKEETNDSYEAEIIRCLCGSSLPTDSMIQCEDARCNDWQHIRCVIIPENPLDSAPPNHPEIFYCEICRLSRADPFWVTVAHPLYPVKLTTTNVPTDGCNPGQSIEKTFQLTRVDKDLLSKQEYDVQAWCMLLNDKGTFRIHWPQYADLQVNGVPVRTINRPGSQLLGANGRDDGPLITSCTRDGINKISLTGCDARIFCMGVRIVKRRSLHQVLSMIPKEAAGEPFEDALARVQRCVGGGPATENTDSDSDIEVVADFIPVNLRCPNSGSRMKVAGRFKPCAHMGCFDLEVFVEMNQWSKKWQCPICLKNYALEKLIIDPYFNRITSKLRKCGEDVTEIEVKPDGSWRAKSEGNFRGLQELRLWHMPNGTICAMDVESKSKHGLEPIKQDADSDSHRHLKLGIKKNQNGCWVFNKSNDMHGISPSNRLEENKGNNIIPTSCSATGSGRDWEDGSVNQDFSTVHGIEYESISLNITPTHEFNNQIASVVAGHTEVIVLSDSDDEINPGAGGVSLPTPQNGISNSYYENLVLGKNGSSCLGLYGTNSDGFGINMWSLPSGSQGGAGFQFFGSDVIVDNPGFNCSSSINCLVDNPLAFNGNDHSLQIFIPTKKSDVSATQSDPRDNLDVSSNGNQTEDWFSLRLEDGGAAGQSAAAANGLNLGQQIQSNNDSLADTESLLRCKTSRERLESDSPFSFPRQRRSVRPRLLHLSIDSQETI